MSEKVESGLDAIKQRALASHDDELFDLAERALSERDAEIQRQRERHRTTWTQLEQVMGLLREAVGMVNGAKPAWYNSVFAALSRQAEPVEPAPAQDEPDLIVRARSRNGEVLSVEELNTSAWFDALPNGTVVELYRRPAQTAPQPEQSERYTCIGKGGEYELIGRATTAGSLKMTGRFADEVIIYRDISSDALYCRTPGDFRLRMERATPSPAKRGEA